MAINSLGELFEWIGNGFKNIYKHGSMEHYTDPDLNGNGWYPGKFWNDLTGKTNTQIQNNAAASLQEDAQQWQKDMLGYQNNASLQLARELPTAQMEGLQAAGLNPALAAGNSFNSSVTASSAGIANPQASNVSAIQSIANSAISAGMVIKILKTLAK